MYRDYIRISIRSLRKRRLRSWLTMIGIFIGIAAIVSLIGLGTGSTKKRLELLTNLGFLHKEWIYPNPGRPGYKYKLSSMNITPEKWQELFRREICKEKMIV